MAKLKTWTVDIDEIVAFQDGRVAADGKKKLEELLRLDPKDIDYGLLQKQHDETVVAEVLEQAEDTDTNTNEMDYDQLAMMDFDFDFELRFLTSSVFTPKIFCPRDIIPPKL